MKTLKALLLALILPATLLADDIEVTPGTGTSIAGDVIGGVLHQRVKVSIGANDEAADLDFGQATKANSLPVTIASDQDALSCTVTGGSTAANQTTIIGHLDGVEASLSSLDVKAAQKLPLASAMSLFGAAPIAYKNTASGTLTAGSTSTVLNATSHAARVGDIISIPTITDWGVVQSTTTNTITLAAALSSAPGAVGYDVMRPQYLVAASGSSNSRVPLFVNIDLNAQNSTTNSILQQEDVAMPDGGAQVRLGAKRVDTPASDTGATGRAAYLTVDALNKVWGNSQLHASASGGSSMYSNIDLGATGQVVKASAGTLYQIFVCNRSTTGERFLKVYDKATAPTGSDTPVLRYPFSAGDSNKPTCGVIAFPVGAEFAAGISVRATSGVADADTGAPSANDVIVNISYE